MKIILYRIYYNLGINKRAIVFLIAGVIIIVSAKLYANRHFVIAAEKDRAKFKATDRDLQRYAVRGAPTYDELITRAQYYDDYYINEAKKINDKISFHEEKEGFFIPADERFAHIKFKQLFDHFKDTLSEKLPHVGVHGKFFEIQPIHTSIEELNKQLKRMGLLMIFIDRMLGNGFNGDHIASIAIGDLSAPISWYDLNVFGHIDSSMIEVRLKLTLDELLKVFHVLRSKNGYFFVEDVHIEAPEEGQVTQESRVSARFTLVCLDITVKTAVTYPPITPQWRLRSDD